MKQLFLITITMGFMLSCKAQQPIIPLYNGVDLYDTSGAYYKDTYGDFTKLIGIWQFNNDNEVFQIILKKKSFCLYNEENDISFYEDIMYREYKYIDTNGTEIVNTLNNINSFTDISQHLIYGGYIKGKNDFPVCNSCTENERRVDVSIQDPLRSYFIYDMEIRHVSGDTLLGTTEQIKIKIKRSDMSFVPQGQPSGNRLPLNQEFILNKQ